MSAMSSTQPENKKTVGSGETRTAATRRRKVLAKEPVAVIETQAEQSVVPYDESLLERARTQWQFGDWQSLTKIENDTLQHHPDRAKLALLVAAGHMQTNDSGQARQYLRLSQDWGISRKLLSQILIAGVHNSLARAAAVAGKQARALKHFEFAIAIGTPGSDATLLTQARSSEQLRQLGLDAPCRQVGVGASATAMAAVTYPAISSAKDTLSMEALYQAWQAGRWDFLAKLDNAEVASQPHRAELALYAAAGYQQLDDMIGLQRSSRLAVDWGCSRDKLKNVLGAGIRNTLAILETLAGQYESAAENFVAALKIETTAPKREAVINRIRWQLRNLQNIDVDQAFNAIAKHIN
ncbi:hypothetical protein [Accumulibacter sp.]|uniref:hypothetical protein n=1 Tax=Accumulibacter sp. TaxID=2053492 RepID=UPI002604CB48|nr:hypothetical protein [Accumulibacter sp.]